MRTFAITVAIVFAVASGTVIAQPVSRSAADAANAASRPGRPASEAQD